MARVTRYPYPNPNPNPDPNTYPNPDPNPNPNLNPIPNPITPTLTLKLFGGAAFLVTGLDDDEAKAALLTLLKVRTVIQP